MVLAHKCQDLSSYYDHPYSDRSIWSETDTPLDHDGEHPFRSHMDAIDYFRGFSQLIQNDHRLTQTRHRSCCPA